MIFIWILVILIYLIFNTIITIAWIIDQKTNALTVIVLLLAGLPIMVVSLTIGFIVSIVMIVKEGRKN